MKEAATLCVQARIVDFTMGNIDIMVATTIMENGTHPATLTLTLTLFSYPYPYPYPYPTLALPYPTPTPTPTPP